VTECPRRPILDEIIRNYPGRQDGRHRCQICRFSGHNQLTCPCLKDAKERIREEE
jgi:hypothetical protein